ncbi:MAG: efflux RND transporter permease subunit, partial [Acinetobacter sp.]
KLDDLKHRYLRLSKVTIQHQAICLLLFAGLICVFALFYRALPTSFLPSEDQGILSLQIKLQEGAPMKNTIQIGEEVRKYFLDQEQANVSLVMIRYGRNFSGTGQNLATGFVALKHWDERSGQDNTAQAIRERALKHFQSNRNAQINVSMPASVNGLGQTDGLDFWIRDINGNGRQYLEQQYQALEAQAGNYASFENLGKRSNPEKAELRVNIDQKQAMANGLTQSAINSTLSTAWGGSYINDFIDRGRIKRVIMQGDAEFRSKPEDLAQWHVRNDQNQMVPFSNFSQVDWSGGPEVVNRFMGYTALQMEADRTKGSSSGQAMQDVEDLVAGQEGVDVVWSGLSFEEKQSNNQAIWLYLISIGFIFLCLAALYESWSIPTAVMSAIPLGIGGNIIFSYLAGFPNDIYFQIALLTTIGLSCKNAILIVEFASLAQQQGRSVVEAALEGASLRLRPILMTSLAFGAGILPLVFATGAGAVSRQEIGVSVFGGVVFGTVLVLVFIPFMYVLIRSLIKTKPVAE